MGTDHRTQEDTGFSAPVARLDQLGAGARALWKEGFPRKRAPQTCGPLWREGADMLRCRAARSVPWLGLFSAPKGLQESGL